MTANYGHNACCALVFPDKSLTSLLLSSPLPLLIYSQNPRPVTKVAKGCTNSASVLLIAFAESVIFQCNQGLHVLSSVLYLLLSA